MHVCIDAIFIQTQKLVEDGDIDAARSEFQVSIRCRMLAWRWCTLFVTIVVTLDLVLGIVYGVANSR